LIYSNSIPFPLSLQAKADLLSQSHEIEKMVNEEKLKIATAVYNINTGKVEWVE